MSHLPLANNLVSKNYLCACVWYVRARTATNNECLITSIETVTATILMLSVIQE